MVWVAAYSVADDGFVAQQVAEKDLRPRWHYRISEANAIRLRDIGCLPSIAVPPGTGSDLNKAIEDYQRPDAA